eukprot:11155201-Lingulodinium_polyedra.AAC.1
MPSGSFLLALAMLSVSSGVGPPFARLPSARGAAAQDMCRRDVEIHPGFYAARVRRNLQWSRTAIR